MVYIKKCIFRLILVIIGVVLSVCILYSYRSYHNIQIDSYRLCSRNMTNTVKIVVIADQHDSMFGPENSELIEKLILCQPDAIFMAGDMLNSSSKDLSLVTRLIQQLISIAPVYYAMGNHELAWIKQNDVNLCQQIEDAGAVVLDKKWVDVEIKGQSLRIGGLYDYAFYFGDLEDPSNPNLATYNFLTDFQNTDAFKIMLSHRPDSFIFADASKTWDIDLVVSGHLHGGQVVLPFFGGIYGGDQGYFPEYVHGLYEKDNTNIFITSGLSTNKKAVPRWNNPPEIAVLELLPAESGN